MAYSKTTWVDDDGTDTVGTEFTATRMNKIEVGVEDAHRKKGAIARMQTQMSGGGVIDVDAAWGISWSERFVWIPNGARAADLASSGYYELAVPANGTVITGVGGAPNVTVTGGKITLPAWQALVALVPWGAVSAIPASALRVVSYTANLELDDALFIFGRNGDAGSASVKFGTGHVLRNGETADAWGLLPRMIRPVQVSASDYIVGASYLQAPIIYAWDAGGASGGRVIFYDGDSALNMKRSEWWNSGGSTYLRVQNDDGTTKVYAIRVFHDDGRVQFNDEDVQTSLGDFGTFLNVAFSIPGTDVYTPVNSGWTEDWDWSGWFDPATGIYTVPYQGVVTFNVRLAFQDTPAAGNRVMASFYKRPSGGAFAEYNRVIYDIQALAANDQNFHGMVKMECAAGDSFQLNVRQNNGTAKLLRAGTRAAALSWWGTFIRSA